MCVAYISYQEYEDLPLCVATNRDEFHARPTQVAHFWEGSDKGIVGGKDLKAGGAWFAACGDGRWGLVTNYRDPKKMLTNSRSRGFLVRDYFYSTEGVAAFVHNLEEDAHNYNGFNLLLGDRASLCFYSNTSKESKNLGPDLYGLSNHLLDTPWPKVEDGKRDFRSLLTQRRPPLATDVFFFLKDRTTFPDDRLPNTGIEKEWERTLSARFIVSPQYGTRASTLFYVYKNEAFFLEQSYGPQGEDQELQQYRFLIS